MRSSTVAPRAKAAAVRRTSRVGRREPKSCFSAAADLVVKPSTPPTEMLAAVGNATVVAGSDASLLKVCSTSATASRKPASKASLSSKEASRGMDNSSIVAGSDVHGAKVEQSSGIKKQHVRVEQGEKLAEVEVQKTCKQAVVEVRGLSGESLMKADFQLSDRVVVVKREIAATRSIPIWQQMLTYQGEMLKDQCTLSESNVGLDAVLDLVLRAGPLPEDVQALADVAQDVLTPGIQAMNMMRLHDIYEVKAFSTPPPMCASVCVATLHLLSGLMPQIATKKDGSPAEGNWAGCQTMILYDPKEFMEQVLKLPSYIDQGRAKRARVEKCRELIGSIPGDNELEKVQSVARCSVMCQRLVTFLFGVLKYYDKVAEFQEQFGGKTVAEFKAEFEALS